LFRHPSRERRNNGGKLEKFVDLKFPGQYLLVLLIKLSWSQGKTFGSKDGKVTGSGLFAVAL
jgi:hypothetical protein